ncbi:MAG: cytochrome P450 [Burkholderiales bacterium]
MQTAISAVPPRVAPPEKPLGRLGFIARYVRNPLSVVPREAYEQDFVQVGGRMAWVSAPSMVKTVLLDERDKFHKLAQIRLLGPLLGKGILTSEGAEWKWQRQASAPVFRYQDLMTFVPTFVRTTETLIAKWRAMPAGTVQPIERDMTGVTFDVISATLLPSGDRTVASAVERATGRFQRSGAWAQLYAVANVPKWVPQPGRLAMASAVYILRSSVAALLRERHAAGEPSGDAHDDLLHRLIGAKDPETGKSMNDEQLIDNLLTFYLAGHETTAKALTWTLFLLSRSSQWAGALEEEIERVTGGAPVAAEHIERLALVQQVLKESMRIYPPVPMMSRQAVADTSLDGHPVKAGMSVVMPIYAIHRHRKRWEDPDAFDPQRFAPEREAKIPRYQYMPFGAGPRICIGTAFAMIEATAMLATLLRHARFSPVDGYEPEPIARVTLLPRGGMPLKVSLRS